MFQTNEFQRSKMRQDFQLWPSKEIGKISPQKTTIKLDKTDKNSHWSALKIDEMNIAVWEEFVLKKVLHFYLPCDSG